MSDKLQLWEFVNYGGIMELLKEKENVLDYLIVKNLKIVFPSIVAAMQKGRGLDVNVVHSVKVEGEFDEDENINENENIDKIEDKS